jgi:hypothetical protein
MKALVDNVSFTSKPADGTIVSLEKALDLTPESPLRQHAESSSAG